MNTTVNRQQAACFTGHRQMGDVNPADIRQRVRSIISDWYDDGITTYYCGMALGFDMLCAEVLLSMRDEYPDLMLVAAVPFNGQEDRWQEQSKRRYRSILNQADEVVYVSQRFERGCEAKRNRYMIDHSSRVIAFYDGVNSGGTGKTVAMAKRNRMMLVNICLNDGSYTVCP